MRLQKIRFQGKQNKPGDGKLRRRHNEDFDGQQFRQRKEKRRRPVMERVEEVASISVASYYRGCVLGLVFETCITNYLLRQLPKSQNRSVKRLFFHNNQSFTSKATILLTSSTLTRETKVNCFSEWSFIKGGKWKKVEENRRIIFPSNFPSALNGFEKK